MTKNQIIIVALLVNTAGFNTIMTMHRKPKPVMTIDIHTIPSEPTFFLVKTNVELQKTYQRYGLLYCYPQPDHRESQSFNSKTYKDVMNNTAKVNNVIFQEAGIEYHVIEKHFNKVEIIRDQNVEIMDFSKCNHS